MALYRSAMFVAVAAVAALAPQMGLAQDSLEPVDRASIQLGFTLPDFDTEVRADGQTSGGTRVDLSRDLGL